MSDYGQLNEDFHGPLTGRKETIASASDAQQHGDMYGSSSAEGSSNRLKDGQWTPKNESRKQGQRRSSDDADHLRWDSRTKSQNVRDLDLATSALENILKSPAEMVSSIADLEILGEVELTMFRNVLDQPELLDTMAPRLAFAYIHTGNGERAVELLRRTRKRSLAATGTELQDMFPTPFRSWKPVLATAFNRGDLDLTIALVQASQAGANPYDDWAMIARYEAMTLKRRNNTLQSSLANRNLDRYWEEWERWQRKPPSEIFRSLIGEQIVRGDLEAVKTTLEAQLRHEYPIKEELWRGLLRLHPSVRRPGILRDLPRQYGCDAEQALDAVVKHVTNAQDLRRTILTLRLFGINDRFDPIEAGWKPALSTMVRLIRFFCDRNRTSWMNAAMRMFALTVRLHDDVDLGEAYDLVMARYRHWYRPSEGLSIASQMLDIDFGVDLADAKMPSVQLPKGRVRPNTIRYNVVIRTCAQLQPIEAVLATRATLLHLYAHGFTSDDHIQRALIRVMQTTIANAGRQGPGEFLATLYKQFVEPATSHEYPADLHAFLGMMDRSGMPDAIVAQGRLRPPPMDEDSQALDNLDWVQGSNEVPPDLPQWRRDPHQAGASIDDGDVYDHVDNRLHGASDVNFEGILSPDMSSMAYALRLRVFAVVRRDVDTAFAIYRYMTSQGIKPEAQHVAPIIEGLIVTGRGSEARTVCQSLRELMDKDGHQIRLSVALIRGYIQEGDWGAIEDELQYLNRHGIYYDEHLITMVAYAYDMRQDATMQERNELLDNYKRGPYTGSFHNIEEQYGPATADLTHRARITMLRRIDARYNYAAHRQAKGTMSKQFDRKGQRIPPPTVERITAVYMQLVREFKHRQAVKYMSMALDHGMVPDRLVRRLARKHLQRLRNKCHEEGISVEALMTAQWPNWRVGDLGPPEPLDPEDPLEVEVAKLKKNRQYNLAHVMAETVQLATSNCERMSARHPARAKRIHDERIARQMIIDLLVDLYSNGSLPRQAEAMRQDT